MIVEDSDLYLYHLTLQRQSNYIHSCIGHFIHDLDNRSEDGNAKRPKDLQLCIATETHIELYDLTNGTLNKLAEVSIFASITAMKSFHMENSIISFLAITSDSGNLTICRFFKRSMDDISLKTLINEPLTRSGIRRLSPISHIDIDLHGRCIVLSAVEKNKLCFVLNDAGEDSLKIQSPLEAVRPHMLTLDTTSCDVQYDNPCFASIEIDTSENNDTHLIFYILDLGLNHIVKKADYKIHSSANFIMGLPTLSKYNINCKVNGDYDKGNDHNDYDEINPFVVIGFEDYIIVKDMHGYYSLKVQIPKREGQKDYKSTIISFALQTLKKDFFILLQSNHGDLFKLKIEPNASDLNRPVVSLSYFDTIAQAESLHIFKNGYLFANSELNDNYLFQFESLGEDNDQDKILNSLDSKRILKFEPFKELSNLSIVARQKNVNPLISTQVINSTPLIISTTSNNMVRLLSNGINFQSTISSQLPPSADNLWTIKLRSEKFHKLLFLSFPKSTMILKVEDGTIEELSIMENPFNLQNDKTIFVSAIGENSVIQVCENEMRQVIKTKNEQQQFALKLEWFPPAGIRIVTATCTNSQLALGLSNNEITYFEIDLHSQLDTLHELQKRIEIDERIESMAMVSSRRSDFLALGTKEATVKVLSLKKSDPDNFLEIISIQTLISSVNDLKLVKTEGELQLHVGLENGIYSRAKINSYDGQIYDIRTKFLGLKPVSLSLMNSTSLSLSSETDCDENDEESDEEDNASKVGVLTPCVVIHCTRTWVSYSKDSLLYVRPIILQGHTTFMRLSEFTAENMKVNGCCALSSSGALIIGKMTDFILKRRWFHVNEIKLDEEIKEDINREVEDTKNEDEEDDDSDSTGEEEASRVQRRLYDNHKILAFKNDKKLNLYIDNSVNENHLRISVARNQDFYTLPRKREKYKIIEGFRSLSASLANFSNSINHLIISSKEGKLYTYEILIQKGKENSTFDLRLLHETLVEDQVHAMIQFDDKLLVPIFGTLILFGLGKKQLLKKAISATTPSITKITALVNWRNERVAVGDNRESVTLFLFDQLNNRFVPIADDIIRRHVTALAFLDSSTIIGGDKFGNIWTLRLSSESEKMISINFPHALSRLQQLPGLKSKAPNIMECPFKLTLATHFHVNDIPMDFHVLELMQMSDRPAIIYSGLQGTIGCLIPLLSRPEIATLQNLERVMSDADDAFFLESQDHIVNGGSTEDGEGPEGETSTMVPNGIPEGAYSIVGRDHNKYRSYYSPVRNIIDGDLCEKFLELSTKEQAFLCKELKSTNREDAIKSVNGIRTNYI